MNKFFKISFSAIIVLTLSVSLVACGGKGGGVSTTVGTGSETVDLSGGLGIPDITEDTESDTAPATDGTVNDNTTTTKDKNTPVNKPGNTTTTKKQDSTTTTKKKDTTTTTKKNDTTTTTKK